LKSVRTQTNPEFKFIPLSIPEIGKEELSNVLACVKSGWLSTGKYNAEFEALLRDYTGASEVVCLDSCTSAMHLSLKVLGIGKGDEVITTPLTFAATANVIMHVGAKPVLCDVDPDTFNIDPYEIKKRITKRTKAILPVHFAGYPCDQKQIYNIANHHGLSVIEDAAHAIGSSYRNKMIGAFPGLTSFSFYATKNITTGEGGALALPNKRLAKKVRQLRFHGISRDAWDRYKGLQKWRYDIVEAGYKNNMTDILASIGVAQIKKIERFILKRSKIASQYSLGLKNCNGLVIPMVETGVRHSWHLYPCRIVKNEFGMSRDQFMEEMRQLGVGTSVHFVPLYLHTFYKKALGYKKGDFPVASQLNREIVSIPMYTKMTNSDVNRVIEAIHYIQKKGSG